MEGHLLQKEKEKMNQENYEEIIEKFVQVIAKNMNLYGINPSVGRLYGVLYFSEDPMTLDNMREALSMSKTSMSTGVRVLSDMKMVESVYKKGVRKELFQTEEDWYKSFSSLFGIRWKKQTETNIEEAEEAIDKLNKLLDQTEDESLVSKINLDLEKLNYAKNYYEWLMKFSTVVESGEIFKFVPKNE